MKIGCTVGFHGIQDLESRFLELVREGFTDCQLVSWDPSDWTDENASAILRLTDALGITISAFWCGWTGPKAWNFYEGQKTLGLVPAAYRAQRAKELMEGADFAKKLGLTDIVTHMGYIPQNPLDPEFTAFCDAVREVSLHLRQNSQNLLFESGQETPVTMLRCFETVGTDNLFVNLDTANVILYGMANPVDALDTIGTYVRGIHAKDGFYPVNGRELGKEVPLGEGKVDFPAFFRKLRALGYDGSVTIECEIGGDTGEAQKAGVRHAKAYLSRVLSEVYGEKQEKDQ